jgi:hypothetical protein
VVFSYHQIEHKRVVVSWAPSARQYHRHLLLDRSPTNRLLMLLHIAVVPRPSELIGAIHTRLLSKRHTLDTSREGAYRYVLRREPAPVCLSAAIKKQPTLTLVPPASTCRPPP